MTTAGPGVDAAVERVTRWMAARSTRRSFLGRLGAFLVLVAGGPSLAMLLARRAEARVCGQSGVSPKCPVFDCTGPGHVWGWCWYASPGCCSNGGLKKICDCCVEDWPNVHGYCPAGTNVKCIVESCHADPRVQTHPVVRVEAAAPREAAVALSRARFPDGGAASVVVAPEHDPSAAVLGASLAAVTGGVVLLTPSAGLPGDVVAEVDRLRPGRALVVGTTISRAVDQRLVARGTAVERVGTARSPASLSVQVARWVWGHGGRREAAVVDPATAGGALGAFAASAAAARMPLLLGPAAAHGARRDVDGRFHLVGSSLAGAADDLAPAQLLDWASPDWMARALASVALDAGAKGPVLLLPLGTPGARGLAHPAGPAVVHAPGVLDEPLRHWLLERRARLTGAFVAGAGDALGSGGVYVVQSILNRYETRFLTGRAGEGLPVIPQPPEERPVGRARVAGAPLGEPGSYWVGRANPART